jgi:tRNA G18 (ribose-2'-O)-methylase SpoU
MQKAGYLILALEITDESIDLPEFDLENNKKILIILGNEVNGISSRILKYAAKSIMIPMYGKGASLNVSVSAAILIYYFVLKNYAQP